MQHGNTTLPDSFRPRVPVAGNLKIGAVETREGGKTSPKKLDHFRFCSPSATADGVYGDHPDFEKENKAKVSEIQIELPSDDPAVNLDVSYVMATRGAVVCRRNGVTAERRLDSKGNITPDQPFQSLKPGSCGEACPFARAHQCKLASTLRFRIPGRTPLGHVWQLRTTSWNTAVDVLGSMEEIKRLTGGTLARIPIRISMSQQKRNALVAGKGRQGTTFWTVALAFDGTTEEELLDRLEAAQKLKKRYAALGVKSLEDLLQTEGSAIAAMDDVEAGAFAQEFFPDAPEGIVATVIGAGGQGNGETAAPATEVPAVEEGPHVEGTAAAPERKPAGPPATSSQVKLIRSRASSAGVPVGDVDAALEGLSKEAASVLIGQILKNPKSAFQKAS